MAIKPKAKVKKQVKATAKVKTSSVKKVVKAAVKKKSAPKIAAKAIARSKPEGGVKRPAAPVSALKRRKLSFNDKPVEVTRTINLVNQIRQPVKPATRKSAASLASTSSNLFNFMKAPRTEYAFEVGDTVEVFCDHEKGRERVRGWIKGIVVQVDNKMVAVQFRSNVFLTDGWMVPDRILWYPLNSEHIRPVATGKKAATKKDIIPDY